MAAARGGGARRGRSGAARASCATTAATAASSCAKACARARTRTPVRVSARCAPAARQGNALMGRTCGTNCGQDRTGGRGVRQQQACLQQSGVHNNLAAGRAERVDLGRRNDRELPRQIQPRRRRDALPHAAHEHSRRVVRRQDRVPLQLRVPQRLLVADAPQFKLLGVGDVDHPPPPGVRGLVEVRQVVQPKRGGKEPYDRDNLSGAPQLSAPAQSERKGEDGR
jgi:hypothetical protein